MIRVLGCYPQPDLTKLHSYARKRRADEISGDGPTDNPVTSHLESAQQEDSLSRPKKKIKVSGSLRLNDIVQGLRDQTRLSPPRYSSDYDLAIDRFFEARKREEKKKARLWKRGHRKVLANVIEELTLQSPPEARLT